MSQSIYRATAALTVAIGAWSLSPLLIVNAKGLATPAVVALYAVSLGSLCAFVVTFLSKKVNPRRVFSTVRDGKALPYAAALGIGAFVGYPLLYFFAIQTGPPVLVNLVNYLWPIVGLVVASIYRRESRSVELLLATGFGFAGAMLAIVAGNTTGTDSGQNPGAPFILAGRGAVLYGGVSAFVNTRPLQAGTRGLPFLLVALFIGGGLCAVILLFTAIVRPSAVALHGDSRALLALASYAVLLPCAHLSWFTALSNPRIPSFTSAFAVPVLATLVLTVVTANARPEVLSALTLVLCGVAFSLTHERGIPVVFAVSLSALGSIQVSQALSKHAGDLGDQQLDLMSQLIVGLVAIFAGFVLINAVSRYNQLQEVCIQFYAQVSKVRNANGKLLQDDLDAFDDIIIKCTQRRYTLPGPLTLPERTSTELAEQWVRVDFALINRVTRHEWLVLSFGSVGIILALHAFALASREPLVFAIRALSTAVIVGIVFAIRDYDLSRPDRIIEIITSLRRRFDFAMYEHSPAVQETRAQRRGFRNPWLLTGLSVLGGTAIISIILNM